MSNPENERRTRCPESLQMSTTNPCCGRTRLAYPAEKIYWGKCQIRCANCNAIISTPILIEKQWCKTVA